MSTPNPAPKNETQAPLPSKGEKLLMIKISATAADGLPLSGPNSAENGLTFRSNPKASGWELWFQSEHQRVLCERYDGEKLVKRFAIPHASLKLYELA